MSPSTPVPAPIFISQEAEVKKVTQCWGQWETGPRALTSKGPQGEVGWALAELIAGGLV